MVPLGAVMDMKMISDTDRINRYQQFICQPTSTRCRSGRQQWAGHRDHDEHRQKTLPPGFSYDWTEIAYQEEREGNTAYWVFPLCVLFVFLTHSAEYEKLSRSRYRSSSSCRCALCGIAGVHFSGLDNTSSRRSALWCWPA